MLSIALAAMLLSACARGGSSCPTLTPIDPAVQAQAADELQSLGVDSALGAVLAASSADRDKIRECQRIAERWQPWGGTP